MADKHWFHSKSQAAQKAYIAAHPTSKYARMSPRDRTKDMMQKAPSKKASMLAVKKVQAEAHRKAKREHEMQQADRMERLAAKRVKPNSAPIRARVKPNR